MRRVFGNPVLWMVAAEIVVVGGLVGVTWHELAGARAAPPAMVVAAPSAPEDTSAPSVPADALVPPDPSSLPLLPGLNVDPAFWRDRLVGLNGAEAQFEALEWRIVHSALDTIHRYVDTVVLPALERAEKRGAGAGVSG
jgi:hypothetical protein